WMRRDRLSQTLRDGVELPLSEAEEAYEVDILDDGLNVLRTLETNTPSVVYTSAQQVEDFGSANEQPKARIYQLSATVGRGIPLETFPTAITVPPPTGTAEHFEILSRPHIDGTTLIAHRALNEVGGA